MSSDSPRHDDIDEFSFLAQQAADLGVAVPAARRLDLTLPDGRVLSGVALGEGAPRVVLLHGAGLNAHTWDATVLALGAPAVAIDLPGHGDSSWRDDAAYAPRLLAPDVVRGIEEWAAGPVVLVGQSLGGATAAAVAAARPDLVRAVMLVDIVPGIDESGPAELRRFYERLTFPSREDLLDHVVAFGLGGGREQARRGVVLNSRVLPDGTVEWKHHFARIAASALAPAARTDDGERWADLEAVRAPLTLVRGTRGFVSPAALDRFRSRLPQADVVELEAPHNVQEVAPDALAALIRSTLSSTAPEGVA
ncbi:alpha/beta fold hydrolase [Microbacterium sp. Marseille-Q6965]|uniref:alpha/beta fold hydrolase n=1 Tax=Microbacterium sp. Marseille-Q6965 TaxID=2965072 RepID=UPI0021B74827|nr:alpha/beta hydrolase [Microbacterium sp. Marseille-Q6965]